jgi:hypothetical protein
MKDEWGYPYTVTSSGDGDDVVTISTEGDERLRSAFKAKAVAFGGDDADFCESLDNGNVLRVATGMAGKDVNPLDYVRSFDFTPVPPAAPTNLRAVAGDGQVDLTWDAVEGADTTYNIIVDGETVHYWLNGTSFTAWDLVNGHEYSFQVEAHNPDGTSVRSAALIATPQAPVVAPPVTPQPPVVAPPFTPQPPVNTTDTDADGIHTDWLVNGKPVAAPAQAKLATVTSKSFTVKLPKAPKGSKLAVYVGTGNGKFAKAKGKLSKKGELTIKGLKKNTTYEVKLVKVNKAGQQSAASKPVKVKTKKN